MRIEDVLVGNGIFVDRETGELVYVSDPRDLVRVLDLARRHGGTWEHDGRRVELEPVE